MQQKLPISEFLDTFKNAPRVAISLLIKDKNGKVLLTKRRIDPFKDFWHLPGSFVLKNESLQDCIKRIQILEIGKEVSKNFQLEGIFEDMHHDPRGHVLEIIYNMTIDNTEFVPTAESKEIAFFTQLPDKIGFNHPETLRKLGYT